ncbi:MAG: DEAD/DEAH box helicase family protein [Bdellovibrionales bacterium]|nr:DEAD/DEAH box helicase family protein [Bdellovibrionales bacterium]
MLTPMDPVSIDKQFRALKKKAAETQFQFNKAKAEQKLRPYQVDALLNLERLLKEGPVSVGVQLPTGAGKTFLIHAFVHRHFLQKDRNVVVVVPSWEIANQHAMTLSQQFEGGRERVCRMGGGGQLMSVFPEYLLGMKGKVIITTSALFYARSEKLRGQLSAALIVIDEGHHGWKKKRLASVQDFARDIGASSVFLTATPPRNMESLPFAAQIRYLDLVGEYLVPCQIVRLETGQSFSPEIKNGVLNQASRVEISSREARFVKIVTESLKHMRGQTIYYAGSVIEAEGVMAEFEKQGVSATVVHSKWEKKGDKINALNIEKFRRGEVRVLVNVQMLAMGFDVPNVETIVVARPVESDTLFTQMVGRGARPAPGKENFILIDVHDTIHKPEVAKIFEHKHLFYSDVNSDATKSKSSVVMPVRRWQPVDLTGFPYQEGQLNERMSAADAPEIQEPIDLMKAAWGG